MIPAVSYDVAVWEGQHPVDDEAGTKFYLERIVPRLERDPRDPTPATPRIRAYVEALLKRWPDLEDDDDSPWSTSPLLREAVGWFIYFPMAYTKAEEASAFAADLAQQQGLFCYDPQLSDSAPVRDSGRPGRHARGQPARYRQRPVQPRRRRGGRTLAYYVVPHHRRDLMIYSLLDGEV